MRAACRKGLLLLKLALLAVAGVLSVHFVQATGRQAKVAKASPVWQLDLRPLGFVTWRLTNARISFPSGDTVVPAWLLPSGPAAAVPAGGARSRVAQYRLEALFLDASTGKVRNTKEWPMGLQTSGIIPTGGVTPAGAGRFIVTTGEGGSALYSPTFDQLLQFEAGSTLSVSPDGQTVLVREERGPSLYSFRWIDLRSLQVLRSWDENGRENTWKGPGDVNVYGGYIGPICDDVMMFPLTPVGFLIRTLNGPWQLVRVQSRTALESQFLSRDLLVGWFHGREYEGEAYFGLVRTDGTVLLEREFSSRFLDRPEISADGRRIALPILNGHGGSAFLDIAEHYSLSSIQVYDVESRRWICTVSAKDAATNRLGGLGISPDGSLLAVMSQEGVLRMFRIPAP